MGARETKNSKTFAPVNGDMVRLNNEYFGSSSDDRDELSRELIVEKIMKGIPEIIRSAQEGGEEVARVINVTGTAFNKSPLLMTLSWLKSFGKACPGPRGREDLNSDAYKKLWDHLEGLGLSPFIDAREKRLVNGELHTYYYIAIPCPKPLPLQFGKLRV